MARLKQLAKKLRLAKKNRQTKWAPFWTSLKKYGPGKRVHPGRHTAVKRHWKRNRTDA